MKHLFERVGCATRTNASAAKIVICHNIHCFDAHSASYDLPTVPKKTTVHKVFRPYSLKLSYG
jgi:hypothetical protein